MKPAVVRAGGVAWSGRLPRPVTREIEAARAEGLVTAAHVQAAAYVTHTALQLTAALSAEEGRLVTLCPLGEARYRVLVDNFTGVAAGAISRMGW